VDIPARLRREPAKVLGTAGGAAFLLLGGPQRLFKGARRAILGPRADMPKSMLPKEIDQELRKLGDDGEHVRRKLEREFANYLDENAEARKSRDLGATLAVLLSSVAKPVVQRVGKNLAEQALNPDQPAFAEAMRRARARRDGTTPPSGGTRPSAPTRPSATPPPGGPENAPL
jgi:hypothetical protein